MNHFFPCPPVFFPFSIGATAQCRPAFGFASVIASVPDMSSHFFRSPDSKSSAKKTAGCLAMSLSSGCALASPAPWGSFASARDAKAQTARMNVRLGPRAFIPSQNTQRTRRTGMTRPPRGCRSFNQVALLATPANQQRRRPEAQQGHRSRLGDLHELQARGRDVGDVDVLAQELKDGGVEGCLC